MDKVNLHQLQVTTYIGIHPWEKAHQQTLLLDIEMSWEHRAAAIDDDYRYALCYDTVARKVVAMLEQAPINLIETVAERTADLIINTFKVPEVKVQVYKPTALDIASNVSVSIHRTQA
ncbi:MAG: dihydroneopterin aldolase [Shewanellaceae bacterium]|nr:dihydroneopterin aldolase [Shewanellaceae bacterium]